MIWRVTAIGCGILLVLAAPPAIRHLREAPPPPPPSVRLWLTAPPGTELGAGDEVLDAAISPDSRDIVFVATSAGTPRLWRRRFDLDRAEPLPGTEGAAMPAWKPGGRVISFFADGRLKQLSLPDGVARDLAGAPSPAGATWLGDGSLLFVPDARGPVRQLREGVATDATRLQAGERGHAFPAAVDGGGFVYVATLADGRRVVRLAGSGAERELTVTSGQAHLIGGRLIHIRDGTLMTQRLDPERVTLTGRAVPLAFDVGLASNGHGFFAASSRVIGWAAAAPRARELVWFDLDGRRLGTAGEPADYWQVRLSPDDRDAAVTVLDPALRTLDVFVLPFTATAAPERLTLALAADSDPVWAPRGDRVLFRSLQDGQPNLFVRSVHAPDSRAEAAFRSELDETPSDWRDGTVLFHAPGNSGLDVWALDVVRGMRTAVTRRGFNELDARWSPDGRRIAYVSDESGRPDIYIEPWPTVAANQREPGLPAVAAEQRRRVRVSFGGGTRPQWNRDGRSLFFLRDGRLMRADMERGGPTTPQDPPYRFSTARQVLDVSGLRDYAVAHRSDRVLAIAPLARGESPVAGIILDWMGTMP